MNTKIRKTHLERSAVVYLRQSTPIQVEFNRESTERQYALADRASVLGWDKSQIKVLDGDLGKSGQTTTGREDFHQLMAAVGLGEVGAVFALEASRFSRSQADWHKLLDICALTDTLIIDHDGIYDPNDFNDRVILGFKGTWSHTELHGKWMTINNYTAFIGGYLSESGDLFKRLCKNLLSLCLCVYAYREPNSIKPKKENCVVLHLLVTYTTQKDN